MLSWVPGSAPLHIPSSPKAASPIKHAMDPTSQADFLHTYSLTFVNPQCHRSALKSDKPSANSAVTVTGSM